MAFLRYVLMRYFYLNRNIFGRYLGFFIIICFVLLWLIFFITLYTFCFGDVYLCDDNDLNIINGWGGELDGRAIDRNIPNGWGGELDGRAVNNEQTYNNYERVNYEPYRPWYSQETSQGIRYEMDASETKKSYPYGPDSYGNHNSNYDDSESTLIGERRPNRSGVEPDSSLNVAWPLHEYKPKPKRSIWQYIKDDLNKTRDKVESRRAENRALHNASVSGKDVRAARYNRWAERQNDYVEANRKFELERTVRKPRRFG